MQAIHTPQHTTVLIDDEPAARRVLRGLIEMTCPQLKVVGEAEGVGEGVAIIKQLRPALVFLDVEMGDGQGFDLLDYFEQPFFKVVFTTAHQKFAVRAFKYYAKGYLLKPIDPDDLSITVGHVLQNETMNDLSALLAALRPTTESQTVDRIALPAVGGLALVRFSDLVRLESDQGYTTFYTSDGDKILVARSIGEFENILPADYFYRVHVSHLVNLDFVKKFSKDDGGYLLMQNGDEVPMARRRKDGFMELLRRRGVVLNFK